MALSKKLMTTGGSLFEGAPYFIAAYSSTDVNVGFNSVTVDSSDNIYAVGEYSTLTETYGMLVKFNSNGVIQWEDYFSYGDTAPSRMLVTGITIDQNQDIHLIGRYWNGSYYAIFIRKLDSDGNFIDDKFFSQTGTSLYPSNIVYAYDITNGDIVYVFGRGSSGPIGGWDAFVAIVPTSYSLAYRRFFGQSGTGTDYAASGIQINNRVRVCGRINNYPGGWDYYGNFTTGSERYSSGYGTGITWNSIQTNIANNRIMLVGNSTTLGTIIGYFNDSGSSAYWGKYSDVGYRSFCNDVKRLQNENTFFISSYEIPVQNVDPYRLVIRCYDDSGNRLFARSFEDANGVADIRAAINTYNLAIDSNDDVIIVGSAIFGSKTSAFIAKVPADGTLTGTYGNFKYSAITVPSATSTPNALAQTLDTSTVANFGNIGYTTESGSLTRDFEDIT